MSYTNYGNITMDSSYYTGASYSIDTTANTLGVSPLSGTVLGGATGATGTINPVYTIGGSNGTWGGLYNDNTAITLGKDGIVMAESADIKLGNVSLKNFIDKIEQRLALLNPNPKLEKEWTELKELGDRYRELEKQITEKMKTWDILKRED
jgi:hypothetical protein